VPTEINTKGLRFRYQAFGWPEGDTEGAGGLHHVVVVTRLAELAVQEQLG
jgi:hypothetical protein